MATRQQADIVASAAAGDEGAFRRMIGAHHAEMRRVCAYIAGDLTIADEATQAAWVVAWKRLRDVSGPSHLRPWLVRVAANEAKQILRKRSTRAKFEVATVASQEPGGRDSATGVTGLDLRKRRSAARFQSFRALILRCGTWPVSTPMNSPSPPASRLRR